MINNSLITIPLQTDLQMSLKSKEDEFQLLKEQAAEKKEELLLAVIIKRDQQHKEELESMKKEMDQNALTMQEVCMAQTEKCTMIHINICSLPMRK